MKSQGRSIRISVFEHDKLKVGDKGLTLTHLQVLQSYHGDKGTPYYTLIHKGIKFSDYVGILQVGLITIEVLPKIDKDDSDEMKWQRVLITMLKQASSLRVSSSGSTHLKLKGNSLLDLYFELFVGECEYLLHHGLIKRYRQVEGNLHALKGSLLFSKHVAHNLTHQERFYTRHTTYDYKHTFNCILYSALLVLQQVNTSSTLQSRINRLMLHLPELKQLKVNEKMFQLLRFDRKTQPYRNAIDIARLILLNYHPDIVSGHHHVLALMFSMNRLWEVWVLKVLKRELQPLGFKVESQINEKFWETREQYRKYIKPDMMITSPEGVKTIVDTKWKTPVVGQPSDNDLRQIFAYLNHFGSSHGILLYPSTNKSFIEGNFLVSGGKCSMLHLPIFNHGLLDTSSVAKQILPSL